MKKRIYTIFASILAMSACAKHETTAPETIREGVTAIVPAFELVDNNGTKTTISQSGTAAPAFAWKENDVIGVVPADGMSTQANYTVKEIDEDPRGALFDGGAWVLRSDTEYIAYFPYQPTTLTSGDAASVSFENQTQNGNNSLAHLGEFDYMYASAISPADGTAVCSKVIFRQIVTEKGATRKGI